MTAGCLKCIIRETTEIELHPNKTWTGLKVSTWAILERTKEGPSLRDEWLTPDFDHPEPTLLQTPPPHCICETNLEIVLFRANLHHPPYAEATISSILSLPVRTAQSAQSSNCSSSLCSHYLATHSHHNSFHIGYVWASHKFSNTCSTWW